MMHRREELRVLHLFGGLGIGGAETWLMALLKLFHDASDHFPVRVSTDVCLTGGKPAILDQRAQSLGASLHYIQYGRNRLPGFTVEFRRLLSERRYHAIHDHQDHTSGLHFLLGIGLLPPVRIAHVHNPVYQLQEHSSGWASQLAKRAGKTLVNVFATSIAGTSAQLLQEYGYGADIRTGRAEAVYCGFDITDFAGDHQRQRHELLQELTWPVDTRIILFVGRLGGDELIAGGRSHKNPAFAVEIAAECIKRDPRTRIVFAGEAGAMLPTLEKRVRDLGIAESVRFLGLRADVPQLMLASDALLFPSSAEGLGMVVVEAQAAGLAVVASDTTPRECVVVPELVRFISLKQPASEWAAALFESKIRGNELRSEANRLVARSPFAIENSARKLLSLYLRGSTAPTQP